MNDNLPLQSTPASLYLGCFCNDIVQTRRIKSKLLLMYINVSYDVDLPSEFPKHSELNGIKPTSYKRQSLCQSNLSKLSF